MKLHYTKILLFSLPLNILVTSSSYANTHKKPSITPHHTQTNRSLCECDIQLSVYDNDAEMKSVKEKFDRQTSQRFEEYDERMKDKRQKRKEERDKNIQDIVKKDKMEKSLAEKIEKGCLRCACGIGGGVLPVWCLVSGLWYGTWKQYVATTVAKASTDAGIAKAIEGLKNFFGLTNIIPISNIKNFVTPRNYFNKMSFVTFVQGVENTECTDVASSNTFCNFVSTQGQEALSTGAASIAEMAGETAQDTIATETAKFASQTTTYTTAIIASIVAILVIVLVMVIIYLFLRYRRKKKMNKKLQYTKLLNQ
ncbi:rifin [Plasmodium reichenowi]|uniref:Rifin n=1 Tax=Plasmodium reichenowi TaxID=5854 RepID=A0A060RM58_PLARE|nr:rifin [Plasmodium reichenowi]